jgi:FOG: WD40 repeat
MTYLYDAFISYRHGELDGMVAERLHKLLEAYRIPGPLAKKMGRKKLNRIFRDREELPTSSNLSDSINEALESSRFLILICSRRTCGSLWVMREVERFGALHGKDKIITLLIDGEPDEAFPPGLRERKVKGETIFVEPLAADIRAESAKKSLKLLDEEKLRLLSPILGCRFDDLRRRHRRRKIQQIATVVTSAFVGVAAFGLFATHQYIQINRQMQLKLENQSYVLAEYATNQLAVGNPDIATLLALEALPNDLEKPERPYIPAAERALADALMVYHTGSGFQPHRALSLPAPANQVLLSPGEHYAAVLCGYELIVADTETGAVLTALPTQRHALNDAVFLSEHVLVYTGEHGLAAFDMLTRSEVWQGEPASKLALSGDGAVLAAVYRDASLVRLYDIINGDVVGQISLGGRSMPVPVDGALYNPHNGVFSLNQDGSALAVSFSDGSLRSFDTANGAATAVDTIENATHFSGGFYRNTLGFAATSSSESNYILYDQRNEMTIMAYSVETSVGQFKPFILPDGHYMALGNEIFSINQATGSAQEIAGIGSRIEAVDKQGESYLLSETGGAYHVVNLDEQGEARSFQSDYVSDFLDLGAGFALTGSRNANTVRILRYVDRSAQELFAYDESYFFSEARVHGGLDRVVFYSFQGMRLYNLEGILIGKADFSAASRVRDTQYDTASGNVIVIYDDALQIYSGLTGKLLVDVRAQSVIYTTFGVGVLHENGGAVRYDLATGEGMPVQPVDDTERALPTAEGLLTVREGQVYLANANIGEGDIIGAGYAPDGTLYFAIATAEGNGTVLSLANDTATVCFTFETLGRSEAFFAGGYVFISPMIGDAGAYTLDGRFVRSFRENGALAEVVMLGDTICANYYLTATTQRFSLLLAPDSLEPVAQLPGFLGETDDGRLVLDSGSALETLSLLSTAQLMELGAERLGGKTLTPEERQMYKAW